MNWREWRWWQWLLVVPMGLFLLLIGAVLTSGTLFELVGKLIGGWVGFLGRVLPEVEVNHGMLWSGVGGAVLAGVMVQQVMRWFVSEWRVKQTVAVMGVLGALFAASICGAGIVHQVVWLANNPMVRYVSAAGVITKETNNLRQVFMGLKLYAADHDGDYPETLEVLVEEKILERLASFSLSKVPGTEAVEPVAYYGSNLRDDSSGRFVVLASARPLFRGEKRVVVTNDGSTTTYTEEVFREMLAEQVEELRVGE